jgi:heptosyltransferase I
MEVLVVRLGSLGDVVNAMWSVAGLKRARPDARITWIVDTRWAALLSHFRCVDQVVALSRGHWARAVRWLLFPVALTRPAWRRLGEMIGLQTQRYDVALDYQGSWESAYLGLSVGAADRPCFSPWRSRMGAFVVCSRRVPSPKGPMPRAEEYLVLARAVAPDCACVRPEVQSSLHDAAFAEEVIRESKREAGRVVGIHPGTSRFGKYKRWPVERYAQVARHLATQCNTRILVTWGAGELALAEELVQLSNGAARLAPRMTLCQLMELLRRLDLYVASDTGPMHLAALVNTPVVAIFGPKDPRVYGPYGCPNIVVRKELACSPCRRRRCPEGARCIQEIQAQEVSDAAQRMLASSPALRAGSGLAT